MHRFFNAAITAIALALPALSLTAIAQERFTATVTGQGPDVILIPGLASSGAVWDATVKQLSPTHRVHVLQVNGFAGSPPGPNADGAIIAPLTAEIAAYAGKLDHPAIIGHSMGGLMALKIAAAKPAAIGRVANTGPRKDPRNRNRKMMQVDALYCSWKEMRPHSNTCRTAPAGHLGGFISASHDR